MVDDASKHGDEEYAGAEIKTFLIADVRGYTVFTSERGDEAAAKLAAKFAGIVRKGVRARGGALIELRGDEGLAVFSSARQAIRAALEIQTQLVDETIADPSLPLPVGIGLDAGEAVPVEGGYRGGALNLAARLCGIAGPAEILASQEVVHLARKLDGVRYVDRGPTRLKGLDDPVRVIRIQPEKDDPSERLSTVLAKPAPQNARRGTRRSSLAIVAGVVALLLVAVSLPFILHHGAHEPLSGDGIQLLDPSSGKSAGSVSLPGAPTGIASGDGFVWATLEQNGNVVKVDPATRAVVETIPVGRGPQGIAIGSDAVWVAVSGEGQVARINPTSGTVVDRVQVGNGASGIATSSSGVWVTNFLDNTVTRIDPSTDKPTGTWPVGSGPVAVSADAREAWVADQIDGTLTRVTPTGQATSYRVGNGPAGVAIAPTGVWVTNGLDGTVSRVDPATGSVVETVPVGSGPVGVTVDGADVWVADRAGQAMTRVQSGTTHRQELGVAPVASVLAAGDLWVASSAAASAHRGGTLHAFFGFPPPDYLDPAVAYTQASWAILSMTNDGLVAFDQVGGPVSSVLVPDLAVNLPVPTDQGRTYTFELRDGIRYSTGALVKPGDFRLAIERVLLVDPSYAPAYYYTGILGAKSCTSAATCNLEQGIVTNDAQGTVTFHLTAPDPEFLYKLALPYAFAVPAGTPLTQLTTTFVPATGPYQIQSATHAADGFVTDAMLVRNPKFVEWSQAAQPQGYPDRIVESTESSGEAQVTAVERGQSDVMQASPPSDFVHPDTLKRLQTLYPGQVYAWTLPNIRGYSMNTTQPPFNDVRVRRAVNLAADRGKLVDLFGGDRLSEVTCQVLPTNYPGYRPYCPYTKDPNASGRWSAPDLAKARQLVTASGTRGQHVTIWEDFLGEPSLRYMVGLLTRLGYHVQARLIQDPTKYFPRVKSDPKAQIVWSGWTADYPAASQFIRPLFSCEGVSETNNLSRLCSPSVEAAIHKATALQTNGDPQAGDAWSDAARVVMNESPFLSMPSPLQINFVSARTGNVQYSEQVGLLLDQLWVR